MVGWILFAVFLTGTISYFRDEVSLWMRPEIGRQPIVTPEQAAGAAVHYLTTENGNSRRWMIDLPTSRDPVIKIMAVPGLDGSRFAKRMLSPESGRPIKARETAGGDFLYYFHFDLYMPWKLGRYLVCLAAVVMLVSIVTGVITHRRIFRDFFTFRPNKSQRSWLDAHNASGVLALPFHVMIAYTGLITLLPLYFPLSISAVYPDAPQQFIADLFHESKPLKPAGVSVPLTNVAPLLMEASRRWAGGTVGRITIDNPGDASAVIRVFRRDDERVSYATRSIAFDGTNGAVLSARDVEGVATSARGILYGLHLARFSDLTLRWLFFLSGLAGTTMVATGLLLWSVKRQRKSFGNEEKFGHRLVDVLNVTTICGLPVAVACYFIGNRILPAEFSNREAGEVAVFFTAWFASGVFAALRPANAVWREQLWIVAVLFAALPFINAATTVRSLPASIMSHDWLFVGFDLMAFGVAVAAIFCAFAASKKSAQNRGTTIRQGASTGSYV